MILEPVGGITLPAHHGPGGFDHAAVHGSRQQLYVAHTANNALDVIDCEAGKYLRSIPHLEAVAGALVSEEHDLVFTSNRGENTVGIFSPSGQEAVAKANNTPYGLSAGIWTEKGSRIFWMAQRLRAGVIWANTYNRFDPASPFGGYQESGFGREGGRHGLAGYLDA